MARWPRVPVVGRRWRVESEISWLRERGGCRAISIFHADNWKPAGQLSSLCKLCVAPIYSDLERGRRANEPTFSYPSSPPFFLHFSKCDELGIEREDIRLPPVVEFLLVKTAI